MRDEIKDRQVPYINAIGGFVIIVLLVGFAVYLSLVHQRYILASILAVIAFIDCAQRKLAVLTAR